ncbi:HIT family protein [Actinoplanes sp. NPDC020271]|uniref:HIT family protein n=1 Tax=Actinoplanes sp. NPDC020271 TaxID=3363896 RepID=UPI0037B7396D
MSELACEPCRIAVELRVAGRLHPLTGHWVMNAAIGWDARPWFVVQTAVHRASLADLDDAEAAELGPVSRAITRAVTEATGAERVYFQLLNEAQPPHVHFHVIARLPADPPGVRGPALLGTPGPAGGPSPEIAASVAARTVAILGS